MAACRHKTSNVNSSISTGSAKDLSISRDSAEDCSINRGSAKDFSINRGSEEYFSIIEGSYEDFSINRGSAEDFSINRGSVEDFPINRGSPEDTSINVGEAFSLTRDSAKDFSISTGPAEDFSISRGSVLGTDKSCVPCFSDGQHVEACAFCVECEEYLCNTCLQCHRKTKASRHHQLLTGKSMDKHSESTRTAKAVFEKCATHTDKALKFYCNQHNELGCSDCITLNHKTCDLDYLPDECANIAQEYPAIMKKLEEKLKDAEAVVKTVKDKEKEIAKSYNSVINKITAFRKHIDKQLDIIQKKTETNTRKIKDMNKQRVKDVRTSCTESMSVIKNLQTSLKENKTRRENGRLYITMKKAKSTIESEEVQNAVNSLHKTNAHFTMECYDDDLPKVFLEGMFGDLKEHSIDVETLYPENEVKSNSAKTFSDLTERDTNEKIPTLGREETPTPGIEETSTMVEEGTVFNAGQFKYEGNLHVRTENDLLVCNIVACGVLPPNRLVLADSNNVMIKLADLVTNTVIDEIYAGGPLSDLAVLPLDVVAVTVDHMHSVILLKVSDVLKIYSFIPGPGFYCRGITCNGPSLYIASLYPSRITELDIDGFCMRTISPGFDDVDRLSTSPDRQFLYLSNFQNHQIVRKTKDGKEAVYENKQISGPLGMAALDDGSLLVCSRNNRSIHRICPNFKHSWIMNDRVHDPQDIGYNVATEEVYVCQNNSNKLKIFRLQNNLNTFCTVLNGTCTLINSPDFLCSSMV